MIVDCEITYGALCKQLQVETIPGAVVGVVVNPLFNETIMLSVEVSDDDMISPSCHYCDDEPEYQPPESGDLERFLEALVAGELAIASSLAGRTFDNPHLVEVCERTIRRAPQRRAA